MSSIAFEVSIIFLLLVGNGIFSMAEISIVAARKSKLRQLAEDGNTKARLALELAEAPNTFLSTVQIGITLVGVLAAAYGGAQLAERLAEPMKQIGWLAPHADKVSFGVIVTLLTYFTLVIGELLPKRLGLANPEGIACALAGPMRKLSTLTRPLVELLSWSTNLLLTVFSVKPNPDNAVTEEEVKLLVTEGLRSGGFHPSEPAMVESVMALDEVALSELMTPRAKIIWINVSDRHETIWHKIVVSGHTTFPVYERSRDNVVGIISVKSIYANLAAGVPVKVKDLMTPPLVVPASQTASNLLEKFKQTGKHVALVADEFGGIVGMVTLHDIMEAIIGDLPGPNERSKPRAVRRSDGSWLVDGMLPADEFERLVTDFPLHSVSDRDYETFAGFVVKHLGHVPAEGEGFQLNGYMVEIIDMDGHRVDKVLLLPLRPTPGGTTETSQGASERIEG